MGRGYRYGWGGDRGMDGDIEKGCGGDIEKGWGGDRGMDGEGIEVWMGRG